MAQLPTSSLIIFLDIERYGERPDGVATDLRESMYRIAGEALAKAGIAAESRHVEDRGDGLLILLPEAGPVEVLATFVRELESLVRYRAASRTPEYRMRLRVAIEHGFVRNDGNGWISRAINTAARLVNAKPLRAALDDNPDAHVAVIISDDLYQDVVAQGYPAIDASRYRPAAVHEKEVDTTAWVHIPYVGGGSETQRTPTAPPVSPETTPPGPVIGSVTHGDTNVRGNFTGMTIQAPGPWSP